MPQMCEGTKKEGRKEQVSLLNDSAKTPAALKNALGRMKEILLLKSLSIHKTVVFMLMPARMM